MVSLSEGAFALKKMSRSLWGKTVLYGVVLILLLAFVFIYGVSVHQYHITFSEAYEIIYNRLIGKPLDGSYEAWFKDHVIIEMNLPRMIGAVTIGITLAVCGTVMQSVIKNPLADPYTTGISSGALLGVTLYLAVGFSVLPGLSYNYSLMVNAFVFSLIPTAFIISTTLLKKQISPTMMILVGIGVMYLFSAVSSLVRYSADPTDAHTIFNWTLGTLGRVTWDNVYLLIAAAGISLVFGFIASRLLNVMTGGDNLAKTLGINVRAFRIICLLCVSVLTALVVSFSGTIGFIGLVCPHIARIIVGCNNRCVMPIAAIVGALVLAFSDTVSKIITGTGLPVGAVTALIGAPIFMYLLVRQKNSSW